MPQDPITPKDPLGHSSTGETQGETPKPVTPPPSPTTGASSVDLSKILLPKKDPPAGTPVANTTRVSAGILLEQEQSASLPKQTPTPITPTVVPPPKKEESSVRSIETYQSDIERVIQNKDVSVVSIAAAEAARRGTEPFKEAEQKTANSAITKTLLIVAGIVALMAATAALIFVFKPTGSVTVATDEPSPFINVDQTLAFTVPPGPLEHTVTINALEQKRQSISLSLGLIARLYLATPPSATTQKLTPLSAAEVLKVLSPNIPDVLVRAIDQNTYLLGIHSFDSNQPFLILKTNSYEQAFSGMLSWESSMQKDLSPLFTRTPPLHLQGEGGTQASSSSVSAFIQTGFIDRIVENHDARVIQTSTNDITLLWTFINRNTIVVTTNEVTLREVISRIKIAPIVPIP